MADTAPAGDDQFFGISFNAADRTVRRFGPGQIDRELADPQVFSWIDIRTDQIADVNEVLRRWGIDHQGLTSQFDAPEILPRIVERPDCVAFHLYEIEDPERHLDTSHGVAEVTAARMILVLGSDFVLTCHRSRLAAVAEVRQNCEASFRLAGRTAGFIAFFFLERCFYDYVHLNLANDNFLDSLQRSVSARRERPPERELGVAELNVLTFMKLTSSLHIVLMRLAAKRSPFISEESRGFYVEMLRNARELREAVNSSRELLTGIQQGIAAAAAQRTGDIARVLTIVSAVLLPLTLITGIYGMNFQNMPELRQPLGYYAVLALMALLATGLLLLFRYRGWLGAPRTGRPAQRRTPPG